MSLQRKLLLILGFITLSFTIIILGFNFILGSTPQIFKEELRSIESHRMAVVKVRMAGLEMLIDDSLNEGWERFSAQVSFLNQSFAEIRDLETSPRSIKDFISSIVDMEQTINSSYDNLRDRFLELISIAGRNKSYEELEFSIDIDEADRAVIQRKLRSFRSDFERFDTLLQNESSLIENFDFDSRESRYIIIISQATMISLFVIFMICAAISAIVFVSRVTVGINKITKSLNMLSIREEPFFIDIQRNDELGMLARRIEKVCKSLLTVKDQLIEEEKLSSLNSLVAGVAHEVNTPIGIGITAASFMKDQIWQFAKGHTQSNPLENDLNRFINLITESVDIVYSNLCTVAEQINTFKRIAVDYSADDKKVIKVKDHISTLLFTLEHMYKERGVSISCVCPDDFYMYCNPNLLSRILTILIQNSLKHGFSPDSKGNIFIQIGKVNRTFIIQYRDDGCGIDKKYHKRIFEPFFSTKRGINGGTGLGLYIVYNIIRQSFNGNIVCDSSPGYGVMFVMSFPDESPAQLPFQS